MANKKERSVLVGISVVLVLAVILLISSLGFEGAIVPTGVDVYEPQYSTLKCEQVKTTCSSGDCTSANYLSVNQKGESIYCGTPTLSSDADFYDGCEISLKSSGSVDFSTFQVCEINERKDVVFCEDRSDSIRTEKKVKILQNEKLFINPNIEKYEYYVQANVYGIAYEGAGGRPTYTERCNLASMLSKDQIDTLKSDEDYFKIIEAGEVLPSNLPLVAITGYSPVYGDTRVIERNGDSYFIEAIGNICEIEKSYNGKYFVTDKCKLDSTVECFPNIGNCDSEGRLREDLEVGKTCTPGTLIGTSSIRQPYGDEACRVRCDNDGMPELYDCIDKTVDCKEGEIRNQNYECVDDSRLTEREVCELSGRIFKETVNEDGAVTTSCESKDYSIWFIAIGTLLILLLLIYVRISQIKGAKK